MWKAWPNVEGVAKHRGCRLWICQAQSSELEGQLGPLLAPERAVVRGQYGMGQGWSAVLPLPWGLPDLTFSKHSLPLVEFVVVEPWSFLGQSLRGDSQEKGQCPQ